MRRRVCVNRLGLLRATLELRSLHAALRNFEITRAQLQFPDSNLTVTLKLTLILILTLGKLRSSSCHGRVAVDVTALCRLWEHSPVLGLVVLACVLVYAVLRGSLLYSSCLLYTSPSPRDS